MIEKYNVSGMTCGGCATTVHNLLSKVESVKSASNKQNGVFLRLTHSSEFRS